MIDVFVSHSTRDRDFVKRLAADVAAAGFEPFFDQLLDAGESWAESLADAIGQARRIVIVLSPDSVLSEWIAKETTIALWRESVDKTPVIPVLYRPCRIPELLAGKVYADFTGNYQTGLAALLRALGDTRTPGSLPIPGEATVPPTQDELARLRIELAEAVALFKSNPTKHRRGKPRPPSSKDRRHCFVVMPFGDEDLQVVYEDYLRPTVEETCGLRCERGDDVFGSNIIMDDIQDSIDRADLVIADLTRRNANVFYEVGICHALDKQVLLLAQSMDDVPFDLRHRRVLLYEYTPRGVQRMATALEQHIRAMLA